MKRSAGGAGALQATNTESDVTSDKKRWVTGLIPGGTGVEGAPESFQGPGKAKKYESESQSWMKYIHLGFKLNEVTKIQGKA